MKAIRPIGEVDAEEKGVKVGGGGGAGAVGGARDGVVEAGEDEDVDEGESGEREVKRLNSPVKPSREEVEAHNLIHLPYRNWCRHCATASR